DIEQPHFSFLDELRFGDSAVHLLCDRLGFAFARIRPSAASAPAVPGRNSRLRRGADATGWVASRWRNGRIDLGSPGEASAEGSLGPLWTWPCARYHPPRLAPLVLRRAGAQYLLCQIHRALA